MSVPDEWPACGRGIYTADGEGAECVLAANHDGEHEDGEGRAFTDEDAELAAAVRAAHRSGRPWRGEP